MTDKKPPRPVPQSVVNSPDVGDRLREILKEEGRAPVLPGGPKPEPPVDATGMYLVGSAWVNGVLCRSLARADGQGRAVFKFDPALPCDVEDVGP